jgi:hypothetical protein
MSMHMVRLNAFYLVFPPRHHQVVASGLRRNLRHRHITVFHQHNSNSALITIGPPLSVAGDAAPNAAVGQVDHDENSSHALRTVEQADNAHDSWYHISRRIDR